MAEAREKWESGLPQELEFWDAIITGTFPVKEYVDDFQTRAAGKNDFPDYVAKYLTGKDLARLTILDVGSGPHTNLGPSYNGQKLNIRATDPLADKYNEMIKAAGVAVAIPTEHAEAEELEKYYPDEKFDLVYSRNALDHSYDAIRAFQQMVNVCRPGGVVFVEGSTNEAVRQQFVGLHQWNFMPVNGDLVVWREGYYTSLKESLKGFFGLSASGTDWYRVVIVKDW